MRELGTSARLFAAGIARRLWSLIPGAVLGLAGVYDALVKPFLPPEWQEVSLAVPLPLVVALLLLGFAWAALLTYHELRTARTTGSESRIEVQPGATYINAPGATLSWTAPVRRRKKAEPEQDQPTFWTSDPPTSGS